jgi:hypothetical protein
MKPISESQVSTYQGRPNRDNPLKALARTDLHTPDFLVMSVIQKPEGPGNATGSEGRTALVRRATDLHHARKIERPRWNLAGTGETRFPGYRFQPLGFGLSP